MKTIASALVLSLAAVSPALAKDGNWQVGNDQMHIVDSTIDVATPAGRLQLLERVERASERLCRERVGAFRRECEVDTVRETAAKQSAWGRAVALALEERDGARMAAR
ncbi:UrcA family protein [Novosphingobium sp. G106]|uniref:UrcA family protein n=1 Tax=Novosphingobium sp. G106 TaxID=2849500 RepID=UPI001C2D7659|nr:UrcA family protein [Novosphingobium sp. G106]MBV1690612.1 UrcA family protein [Novosphingobium sp. G106]